MKTRVVRFLALFSLSICLASQDGVIQSISLHDPYNAIQYAQEVLDALKSKVENRSRISVERVAKETKRNVQRAQETLSIIEELALLKLVCSKTVSNSQNTSEANNLIQRTIQGGYTMLEDCSTRVSRDIHEHTGDALTQTSAAISQAQVLVDSISDCAKTPGLQKFSCYRKIATERLQSTKMMAVDAIEAEKFVETRVEEAEKFAGSCVDGILRICQEKVNAIITMSKP